MRPQISRLPANTAKGLAGSQIDRTRPIEFRIQGRMVSAFEGDTVLTALLASGIDTIGTHHGQPIGLRHGAAPAIAYAGAAATPELALPMDRVPARGGADYVFVAPGKKSGLITRLFQGGRTLGLTLDDHNRSLVRPWRSLVGRTEPGVDVLLIGGGVAGMSAALTAARAGLSVTLVEESPMLGGHSGLFGTQDGDATPEDHVALLVTEIKSHAAITVRTHSEAFAIVPGLVRVHQIDISGGLVTGKVLDLPARYIILATGSIERLPVIPGNRRPGVIGAQEAYELAQRYGIWSGHSVMVATSANPAYRLATLLAETGIALDRITDGRDQASSRYIEFSKAYGFRLFPGTVPKSIATADGQLAIDLAHGDAVRVDRLILSGGWQPDLTLWHMAGGHSRWNANAERLEPIGTLDTIALAGAAAGYLTRQGCVTSGVAAINHLLGRAGPGVDDPVISALYETPDRQMCALEAPDANPAYLDAEASLVVRPTPQPQHWLSKITDRQGSTSGLLAEWPQPLSISAISSGVALGLIPPESAGVVAQERVALIPLSHQDAADISAPSETKSVPDYLQGRFGTDAIVVQLDQPEARRTDSGALIFLDHDTTNPQHAVGVVLRMQNERIEALLAAAHAQPGVRLVVRDLGQAFPAEVKA
ncbi:FAD-dependent oxidoreductase [Devosia sp. BK]|uniref:FAD-dependent oxidoreductase n=1 Tax=Devosia sp. BK TaxID=2871706 RepID=UPI002939AFAD|nr:FAD-dependent oxidoreductase [Devosia sp. BK]MDV3251533.1 FAD-dependent oxidoreductase [Devosia sp. BK]